MPKINIDLDRVPAFTGSKFYRDGLVEQLSDKKDNGLLEELFLDMAHSKEYTAVVDFKDGAEKNEELEEILKIGEIAIQQDADGHKRALHFDDDKVTGEVDRLINKHLPNQSAAFKKQLQAMDRSLEELRGQKVVELGCDEEDIAQFKRATFLFGQLKFLKKLDQEQDLLQKAQKRYKDIQGAEDSEEAHKMDADKLHRTRPDQLLSGQRDKEGKYRQLMLPAKITEKARIEAEIKFHENNVIGCKNALRNIIDDKAIDQESVGVFDAKKESNHLRNMAAFTKSGVRGLTHPLTRGILTTSNATHSAKWEKFVNFRNKLLSDSKNDPKFNQVMGQLQRLQNDENKGLINEAEFSQLFDFANKQQNAATEEHKQYLEKLKVAAETANKAILKKIKEDVTEGDKLNKYRIIQLLLICSPFLPIPIAGVLLNAFQPFLSGALDIPNFLSSFFSVDGPFGNLAWLTDKIGLDDLTQMVGNLFGGPIDVVQTLIQNPITTPIFTSLGGGFAASPLSGFALAALFDVATGYSNREMDRMEKAVSIFPDAANGFEKAYEKLRNEQLGNLEKQSEKFVDSEIELRKELYSAAKAADWLRSKYKVHPKSCEILLQNLFGNKADTLIKSLKNRGDVMGKIYELKSEEGFKSLLKLRGADEKKADKVFGFEGELSKVAKGTKEEADLIAKQQQVLNSAVKDVKYEDIKKDLDGDFYFSEAEKFGINHKYIPALGGQLLKKELVKKLAEDIASDQYFVYGKEVREAIDKQNINPNETDKEKGVRIARLAESLLTPKLVDQMIIIGAVNDQYGEEIYDELLNESENPNFNCAAFLTGKGIDQQDMLDNYKPFITTQLVVKADYLSKNPDKTQEDAEIYVQDLVKDPDALNATLKAIEEASKEIKEKEIKLLSELIKQRYQGQFNQYKDVEYVEQDRAKKANSNEVKDEKDNPEEDAELVKHEEEAGNEWQKRVSIDSKGKNGSPLGVGFDG